MNNLIRETIDYNRCNAYSGIGHLYAAISVDNSPVFATYTKDTACRDIHDDTKGGIIVFPAGTEAVISEIKKIAQKQGPAGWTIGRFFRGRYTGNGGKIYSEDSLSVEIKGISEDALLETAEDFCKALGQESALIKSYAERNRIVVADIE